MSIFIDGNVEFLVVGAYALAAHGIPRATGDIDLWINRSSRNVKNVWKALEKFGAPLAKLDVSDLEKPGIVYQIGVAPNRIDILTFIDGVEFSDAWPMRLEVNIEGLIVPVIGKKHLIENKKTVARPQDLVDIEVLESL